MTVLCLLRILHGIKFKLLLLSIKGFTPPYQFSVLEVIQPYVKTLPALPEMQHLIIDLSVFYSSS